MRKRKSLLGELLLEQDIITQEQLDEAIQDQKRWGGKIGQHFVRIGSITHEQLLDFLSLQLGIAKIDFTRSPITLEALQIVPKKICKKYILIPVAKKDQGGQKRLLVAMADPMDFDAIREVEFTSNCLVTSVLAQLEDISRAIDFCYSSDGLRECISGLPAITGIELDSVEKDQTDTVIYTQDGHEIEVGRNWRATDAGLRALIDILVEKGFFTYDEFHEKLEKVKE